MLWGIKMKMNYFNSVKSKIYETFTSKKDNKVDIIMKITEYEQIG